MDRREPGWARRLSWDSDADFLYVESRSRTAIAAVLRELVRTP